MLKADQPTTANDLQYHTHTGERDLSPFCLIVGPQGRAEDIASTFLTDARMFENRRRGFVSFTGIYEGCRISITTSGIGGASIGTILPEAARSGARLFIRHGSCGSLIEDTKPGDSIIVTGAVRYDGASQVWAPPEFPAIADYRVVAALVEAAKNTRFKTGIECTTDCFYSGQGRPDVHGYTPPRMRERHDEVIRLGAACYSMEAASLFTWCKYVGGNLPAGAINTVFANRITGDWGVTGEMETAKIALDALILLFKDQGLVAEVFAKNIPYVV